MTGPRLKKAHSRFVPKKNALCTHRTALQAAFVVFVAILVMGLSGRLSAQTAPPSGSWRLTAAMSHARTGAAAAAMGNGSVLVTGGIDGAGAVSATAEIYGPSGTFTAVAAMNIARAGHTATWLAAGSGGYVLVTGGTTTDGAIAGSSEFYDPASNSWTLLPAAVSTGAAATPLPNSSLLLSGGVSSAGLLSDLVRFDLATQQFSFAGALPLARKSHAACALRDGRVLIAGGLDAYGNTLASIEIYDPVAGTISPAPALYTPRANATATTLLDGKVLIAGGSYAEGAPANGNIAELSSAEIYDPAAGTILLSASPLAQARSGHQAFLLPNNNSVLLVGGTYNGADLASSELYTPWLARFAATGAMSTARSSATGAALFPMVDGQLLVAGGSNQSSAELYGFATIETDQSDYSPGTPVIISGSGWQPGEAVSLYMQAIPDTANVPPLMTTTADAGGNILDGAWSPDETDLGARFYLTGVGASSGQQAQNTFTDSKSLTITVAGSGGGTILVTDTTPNSDHTFTCSAGACIFSLENSDLGTISVSVVNSNSYFAGWSANSSGVTCSGTSCNFSMGNKSQAVTATFTQLTATSLTVAPATASYRGTATLSATLKAGATGLAGQTVSFTLNGIPVGSATTTSGGVATLTNVSLNGYNAGTQSIGASFAQNATYGPSSNSEQLTVSPLIVTANVAAADKLYDGSTTATITSCTLSGNPTNLSCAASGATFAMANASLNPQTVTATGITLGGLESNNYVLSSTSATTSGKINFVTVTASVTAADKTYDGNNTATITSCTLSGSPANVSCAASDATFASASATGAPQTVTATGITLSGNAASNYTLSSTTATTTATINQPTVTATVTAADKQYDGTPAATITSCTLSGSPANVTCTVASATFATANANLNPQTVTATGITLGGSAADNYTLSSTTATASAKINHVTMTASVTAAGKQYDGTPAATITSCTLSGSPANVTCTAASATFATANANLNPQTVTATGITLGGSKADNYTLPSTTATTTAIISQAPATLTLGLNATYTGSAQTPTATTSPANLAVTWTNAPQTNAGTYNVTATINDPNYTGSKSGDFVISPANQALLTVTGMPAAAQQQGAFFTVGYSGGSGTGAVSFSATGACSNDGTTVTMTSNTGTCYVTVTKAADLNYQQGSGSASVAALSLPLGVDLTESIISSPATANAGGVVQVSDTVSNSHATNAGSSYTFYYLVSGTGTKTLVKSLYVPGVSAGSSYPETTSLTIPVNLTGSYSLQACADGYNAVVETDDPDGADNCASAPITIAGPDLKEDPTVLRATDANGGSSFVAGGTIKITDKVQNIGIGNAGSTTTVYYLSIRTDTRDINLGTRSVPALSGTGNTGTTYDTATKSLTIPVNLNGSYYVIACADYYRTLTEDTVNNCQSFAITVAGADLTEVGSSLQVAGTSAGAGYSGGPISVNDKVQNLGAGGAGTTSTSFYLNTTSDPNAKGTLLGRRTLSPISGGGSNSISNTTALTLPANLKGGYWVAVCADSYNVVAEPVGGNTNNCASTAITVAAADLKEDSVTVAAGTLYSGGGISVTDTVKNIGGGNAGTTTTFYYLSVLGQSNTKGAYLGSRTVPALGGTNSATTKSDTQTKQLTLPASINGGPYSVIACADNYDAVLEVDNTVNNCLASSTFSVTGADLVEAVTLSSSAPVSGKIQVSDTLTNQTGGGTAGGSATYYYLSLDTTSRGTSIGSRTVGSLTAGGSSPYSGLIVLPSGIATGQYHFVACADGYGQVAETDESDQSNCKWTDNVVQIP
jgi:MBG domain-containing protein/YDG domain-containing protein/CARDB protein/galactose oxidase-like protein/Kelch motif protein